MKIDLSKTYNHRDVEKKIYKKWADASYFTPKIDLKKKPFTIIMPPPNANGSLHIGHAVFVTLEDIMIRYHRMKGEPTLWLPGADHAGILTQVVFEKELEKHGKTRFDLGREEFYQKTYEFTMKNKKFMEEQLQSLGASCDWSRKHFTLEPEISRAVLGTFKKMYEEGLIYQGKRIINWCPRCATALSDLEVIYKERKTKLWYIKYHLKTQNSRLRRGFGGQAKLKTQSYIVVATTRPETMLGDTAVAVNPKDKRYKNLIGKKVILPLMNQEIPVISDSLVDPKFGTGAVKVTPAHDPVDFEIGQKHKLPSISVIGQDNKMTKEAGNYSGLDVNVCREKVISDLKKLGLLYKEQDYTHSIGTCERCKTIVEPLISKQWFVKIKPLAQAAIEAVKKGKIKFIPKRFEKVYFNWMENIRDWCISRQIWWGHRLPVYYCQQSKKQKAKSKKSCGEVIVSVEEPKKCPKCGSTQIEQDPDTLDTWFSSGQWPFTTLGWPKETKDFKYFYPTSVMETGWDILFFWVARMIMMGLYCTGKVPFEIVYLHGLVRDKDRQKMSKSKGNIIDPLGVAEIYGTDAVRLALVFGTGVGNDIIISEEKIKGFRNFANKIWNASRFVLSNIDENTKNLNSKNLELTKEDKWILEELDKTIKKITLAIDKYNFHQAAEVIYSFFWHKFCDKTIENTKKRLYEGDVKERKTAQFVLFKVLTDSLKMLHPFMPFITEEIWQKLEIKEPLIISKWPEI